jgi:hypothetical protein
MKENIPSEEFDDFGLPDCPPSVMVEGESIPAVFPCPLPFRFCVSMTLIFGNEAEDILL